MSTHEELPFEFVSEDHAHQELAVVALSAEEEMNGLYRVRVELSCPADAAVLHDFEASLLGRRAAAILRGADYSRRIAGTVIAVHVAGFDAHHARISVEIAPRLALLGLRRRSRIFQDKGVREIAAHVLGEWKIAHTFQLAGDHAARPFSTQHGESDWEFVTRLLASEGIGFHFTAGSPDDPLDRPPELVLFDGASYPEIPGGRGGPVMRHAHDHFEHGADEIVDFSLRRELAPKTAILGDFDFRRPQLGMEARAATRGEEAPIEKNEPFEAFFYFDRQEREGSSSGPEIDGALARTTLEQIRRDAMIGRGRTRSRRLVPGHVFTLEGHPIEALNQAYVVTRVEHTGRSPDAGGDARDLYEARFTCVPANVVYRPPVTRGFRAVHGSETATVVGPEGEDVYPDQYGRVKVRFHWDRDSKGDEHSSCWLRVAQGWAGQRWGMQFIPRVGREVTDRTRSRAAKPRDARRRASA
jgi:type VI secretion system secreted protein VgrG